jgi:hypothetical protein
VRQADQTVSGFAQLDARFEIDSHCPRLL